MISKDGSALAWRRSSACSHSGCVEVQFDATLVRVRNSERPERTVEFTTDEWSAFLLGAVAGEFEKAQSASA